MKKIEKIKKLIKNKQLVNKLIIKAKLRKISRKHLDPEKHLIEVGKVWLKYQINLQEPRTLNEKLNWYKLHYKNPLMTQCVDKIDVDEYVKSKGLDDILIPKLAVWNSPEDIDLSNLPEQFVIKMNNDSGSVFVCREKKDFTIQDRKEIQKKYKQKYSSITLEWPYDGVKKKIFAEKLLTTRNGKVPEDYKFFCFNGEPKFLYVVTDRNIDTKFDFFDTVFNWIDVRQGHENNKNRPVKPKNFDTMIKICRKLSEDFPQVRVDLYNIDGNIYFGELTFFHDGGFVPFEPFRYDEKFGEFFELDEVKKSPYFIE